MCNLVKCRVLGHLPYALDSCPNVAMCDVTYNLTITDYHFRKCFTLIHATFGPLAIATNHENSLLVIKYYNQSFQGVKIEGNKRASCGM